MNQPGCAAGYYAKKIVAKGNSMAAYASEHGQVQPSNWGMQVNSSVVTALPLMKRPAPYGKLTSAR